MIIDCTHFRIFNDSIGIQRSNPISRKKVFAVSLALFNPGGGVTTIYAGTGCAIFWGAFFRAKNKFWGIIFAKITSSHKFWGVILENNSLGH